MGRRPPAHFFAKGEYPQTITEAGGHVFMVTSKGVYRYGAGSDGAPKFEPVMVERIVPKPPLSPASRGER